MRNLLQFLWKHNFFILFVLLEIFAVVLTVKNNNFHKASYINSINDVRGRIYNQFAELTDFINLKETNQLLAEENNRLREELSEQVERKQELFLIYKDTIHKQKYSYRVAKVINNNVSTRTNFITINKGSNQGIQKEMAVVTASGIVGIVKNVSANYATVISLLHIKTRISAKIKKNNYFGSLSWDTHDPSTMTLRDIPSHVKINIGDSIVTSAYSVIFPEGMPIGKILSIDSEQNQTFHEITVELFANFRNLSYVYVIGNLEKAEQVRLEQTVREENNGD